MDKQGETEIRKFGSVNKYSLNIYYMPVLELHLEMILKLLYS